MELLGQSLEDLFQSQQKKFSLKTVAMIGIQILDRLEYIHEKNFLHRNIIPKNFALGLRNKSHIIYILDFGLSKKYRHSKTKQHMPMLRKKKFIGKARYASINSLRCYEQSRRDDLESLGYVLLYFLRGSLPWQGLPANNGEDKRTKILQKKMEISPKDLCEGFPHEFVEYINYTRKLKFEAEPDYKFLRGLLITVLEKQKASFDFYYDWLKEKPNINDEISVERYIKNNLKINFEISEDKKDEEEKEKDKTDIPNNNFPKKFNNENQDMKVNNLNNMFNNLSINKGENCSKNQNQINFIDSNININMMNNVNTQNNSKNNDVKLVDLNQIIVIQFISTDQKINRGIACLPSETFAEIEEKLYKIYPEYRLTNNNFITNGNIVFRFRTIAENNIKDGQVVQLITID